ncbi:HAMP domain-containing sensor histidine kinase [Aneurinibacillus aneurinilyticus]|uniref:sensor histidine kinase n=1 Tax=Aneurinibacillus aneurinilyticus TaxID=1391 RepID=UPI002E1AC491|nr:HAMP domain-containing sensor histidine kinase [Aneurinibacillus aneurinilyticus]
MNRDKSTFLIILQLLIITSLIIMDLINQPQGNYRGALFAVLFITTGILLFMRLQFMAKLKGMAIDLKRAIHGNFNTRLLADDDHILAEAIFSINELIEQLDKFQVQTIKSEAVRKSLLSNISHDIRTPLTSIIGYVDALKDDIAASEEEKQEYLAIISKKANSLKQLIDEIFHMAKLDADEVPLKEESLDFAEIARESLIEFLPVLKKYDIELKVRIPEENCLIMADRLSLLRIIRNIINNAVQYGQEGKILGIELTETAREYQLLVWDRGPGISKVNLSRVFERMYRSDQSRNPLNGGSGLGLAIAKALVEKNRGRIWVESIPWEKTTFGFSIPKHNE